MLDVLDEEWVERQAQDDMNGVDGSFTMRKNSLLVRYLSGVKGRSSALRRVVGALFVDGGSEDLRAYPEVFMNETLELKKAQSGQKRKREDDLEHTFGEGDELEFDYEAASPSQKSNDALVPDPWIGGFESIKLRQRVLTLVSRILPIRYDAELSSFQGLHSTFPMTP